jgi:hypothetical protein
MDIPRPDDATLDYIASAAAPLPPGLAELIEAKRTGDPRPGELWRVGVDQAQLVWVRRVFADGVADVIPVSLWTEHADETWLLVPASATALACELGVMTMWRTHIVFEAFLNCMDSLDIAEQVEEVISAAAAGRRPVDVHVGSAGWPTTAAALEHRQEIHHMLGALAPGVWTP